MPSEGLVTLVILTVSVVTGIGIIGGTVVFTRGFTANATETAAFLREILRGGNALRLLTVVLVVYAIMVLAALNRLPDNVVTLLSSIGAFSLGGLRRGSTNSAGQ